jgi:hypothetical protein
MVLENQLLQDNLLFQAFLPKINFFENRPFFLEKVPRF